MHIAIDTGGTNTRIATAPTVDAFDPNIALTFPTPPTFTDAMDTIIAAIKPLTSEVTSIAMGVPGSVNAAGEIIRAPNLPDWIKRPLQNTLATSFACPVVIRNDAEMGALGEAHYGDIRNADFAYIAWGTGIGFAQVHQQNGKSIVSRPANRDLVHDLEAKIGGRKLEDRFGKPAKLLTSEEWSAVLADIVSDVPPLLQHYGSDTVIFGGGVATAVCPRLAETLNTIGDHAHLTTLSSHSNLYGAWATGQHLSV